MAGLKSSSSDCSLPSVRIEAYGKGPGWYAEGEAKALQLMKKDMLTVAELMVKPPMKGPAELQNRE